MKAASDEADRYFVAFRYGAGAGAESVSFDPKWVSGEDALAFLHATVREQSYRRGMAWRVAGNGPAVSDPVWRMLEMRMILAFVAEDHKNTAMVKTYVAAKGCRPFRRLVPMRVRRLGCWFSTLTQTRRFSSACSG